MVNEQTDLIEVPTDGKQSTAAELNELVRVEAEKAGVTLEKPAQPRAEHGHFASLNAVEKNDEDAESVFEYPFTIGDKEFIFTGKTAEEAYRKALDAVHVAGAVAAPVEKKETAPAIDLTADEMFEIGVKLQQGDATAIGRYLEKSNFIKKYFEKEGVRFDAIKENTQESVSRRENDAWKDATTAFLEDNPDFPQAAQNTRLMGWKMAELGVSNKPSPESLKQAYEALKEDGMLFPATTSDTREVAPPAKRRATASSFTGNHRYNTRPSEPADKNKSTFTREQIEKMSGEELARVYNSALLDAGHQPIAPGNVV